jgi:flagellar secretion chaperone FliS
MSGNSSLAHRYREVAIKTANPLQLVVILYDAAICALQEARLQIEHRDIAGRSRSINKCSAIISELQSCLNTREGGEIARSLNRLYDYMKWRVFKANLEQSAAPLLEVEALLDNLRSAWGELVAQPQKTMTQPPAMVNRGLMAVESHTAPQMKSFNISG